MSWKGLMDHETLKWEETKKRETITKEDKKEE